MARWLCNLCLVLALLMAAPLSEAAAMPMPAADMAQCDGCLDESASAPCAVACPVPWSALAPAMPVPTAVTNIRFAPRRLHVLAGSAGPPDPQPPRLPARA